MSMIRREKVSAKWEIPNVSPDKHSDLLSFSNENELLNNLLEVC